MNISGEPAALEKYNFSVGKGRVTDGKFGGDSMEDFFKRTAHVGEGKGEEHYADFSFAGGHLKDKVSFLQSGAWGLDPIKAQERLQKLNEEAEAAAKKTKEAEDAKKNSGTQEAGEQTPVVKTEGPQQELKTGETVPNTNPSQVNEPQKDASIPVANTRVTNPESEISDSVGIQVESKKSEQSFLSRDILKEKAGKLLDKILEAQEKDPALIDKNPAATRLAKSIHRFAEGSSLDSLKFAAPQTEHLFLASADDYLTGLESEVAALSQPSQTSSDLIDQYPEQFQTAVQITSGDESITTSEQAKQKFESLGQEQKQQVLELFGEFVKERVSSVESEDSQSSQSTAVDKSAQLLQKLGLQRREMPDDGNCFFFAVADNELPSQTGRFSDLSTEANHQRQNLLETFSQLTPEQAQKSFPGQELFKTWQALESGLPTTEDYLSAKDAQSGYKIDSSAWGTSSHLKLNAIRTGKPQIAIDAASNKVEVYHSSGNYKSVDASDKNATNDLRQFIQTTGAQIYEALPSHWNAARLASE
jgi:hypothetical protein